MEDLTDSRLKHLEKWVVDHEKVKFRHEAFMWVIFAVAVIALAFALPV